MSNKDNKGKKKLNLKDIKERITDDSLDLSVCSLEAVPVKEISEQTKVRKLNLSYNLLVTLSDDFIKLQYIRELDLSKNKLKSLPKNFGALTNLKNLDLLGNELTTLPSTFSELKSLQWLDLKDNPLEEGLKRAAGDCLNEPQCKRCATNVIAYMKQVAIEEERRRQVELKKKRDEQAKKEAEEKVKADQLRAQKKTEREHRRLVNEQKKQQLFDKDEDHDKKEANGHATKRTGDEKRSHKSSSSSGLLSLVFFVLFLAISVALVFLLFSSYCDGGNKDFRRSLREKEWLGSVLAPIDGKVCPFVIQNRPIVRNYIKPLEFF